MPEYLAPGVYVEETSFRPKTIEGVSTSTAGFVGPARTGPTSGEPPLLTSFADFRRVYGGLERLDFQDQGQPVTNHLAYAVRAFFEEGGQRCYVARVFDELGAATGDLNLDGRADGTKGELRITARHPGTAGNMRVVLRPVASRDVSQKDRSPSDETDELPGLSLGDTVFAEPGEGTAFGAGGVGTNFYDYILDQDGDRALQNGSTRVKVHRLEKADRVYPLQVSVQVQRAVKQPGGGIEFGPEEEVGTYTLRPNSSNALVDALGEEPAGDPARTPILVPDMKDDQGNPETSGTGYASEIFSAPLTGEIAFPVTVSNLSDVTGYRFELPFDPSTFMFSGVDNSGETLTPTSKNVTFRRSRIDVQKEPNNELGGSATLLNVVATLRKGLSNQVKIPIEEFELLDANGAAMPNAPGLAQQELTVAPGNPNQKQSLSINLNSDPQGQGVFAYRFRLPFDASTLAIGIDPQGTLTPPGDPVDVTPSRMFGYTDGLPKIGGTDPLVNVRGRVQTTNPPSPAFGSFETQAPDGSWQDVTSDASIDRVEIESADLATAAIRLSGGNDGNQPVSYETDVSGPLPPESPEGFDALEDLDDVSIVAAPGYTEIGAGGGTEALNVQGELIQHCEDMQYRIAVLDTPKQSEVRTARDWRGNIDSTHAAMYYPWITIFDPLTRSELDVPPSGHVAGIYARSDVQNGVHKAPANEVVRSAVGFEKRINKRQQDVLNPEGVNCFRFFEGRGNRLWGARMATSDNEYKYVNIRRYLAYLERSIDQGTQVFVFENNGSELWRNVQRTIASFLENEWQSNRLMGTMPEQAFFVRCDRSTMTQNDIDNGRLICEIGVALFRPAEFVIFRIGQKLLEEAP